MSAKKKPSNKKEKPTSLELKLDLGVVQFNISASTNDSELLKGVKELVKTGKASLAELNEHWDELGKLWEEAKKESEAKKDDKEEPVFDFSSLFDKNTFTSLAEALGIKPSSCCHDHEHKHAQEAKGEAKNDKPERPKSNLTATEFESALRDLTPPPNKSVPKA